MYETISIYLFISFISQIPHINESIWYVFLCLTYFTKHDSFLWLGNISLCVCVYVYTYTYTHTPQLFKIFWGLPWWRSGWESACQCRAHGFEPWSGKIPRAVEQLGPWATITEPARLERVLRNKRGRDNERPAHRDEDWPPLTTTRESPCTETKTQHSHK